MSSILQTSKKIIPAPVFNLLKPYYHFSMSFVAALRYGFPSRKLIVIGVTGTTGKTTSTFLMKEMFKNCGLKVGYTSTAMFSDGTDEWLNDKKMTMLGRFFTQKMLAKMVKNGCQYAIVETTSEGIIQYRHRFINYDTLVFTGLYPEHIESHGGFENYKLAKALLFAHLEKCKLKYKDSKNNVLTKLNYQQKLNSKRIKKTIIVNGEDKHSDFFLRFWAEKKYKITSKNFKTITKDDPLLENKIEEIIIEKTKKQKIGHSFSVHPIYDFSLNILGNFNVLNATFGIVAAYSQGLKISKVKEGLARVTGIPGRLERLSLGQDFEIIVDYAFEPNALEKLFNVINTSLKPKKIIHVLGSAGGGRDVARRPQLGKISAENASVTIVTNEDPYDEDPRVIINQVAAGARKVGALPNTTLYTILDRRDAIKKALSLASKNDLVLVTGKGSEQAICVRGGKKIPWDDRQVIKEEVKK